VEGGRREKEKKGGGKREMSLQYLDVGGKAGVHSTFCGAERKGKKREKGFFQFFKKEGNERGLNPLLFACCPAQEKKKKKKKKKGEGASWACFYNDFAKKRGRGFALLLLRRERKKGRFRMTS